jgi:hypothetical protein
MLAVTRLHARQYGTNFGLDLCQYHDNEQPKIQRCLNM